MVFIVNFKIGLSIVAKTKGHLSFPLEWSPGMKSFNETSSHGKVKISSKSFVECNSKLYNLETLYIRPKIHPRINYSKLSHYTPKNQFSCHHFISWHYSCHSAQLWYRGESNYALQTYSQFQPLRNSFPAKPLQKNLVKTELSTILNRTISDLKRWGPSQPPLRCRSEHGHDLQGSLSMRYRRNWCRTPVKLTGVRQQCPFIPLNY